MILIARDIKKKVNCESDGCDGFRRFPSKVTVKVMGIVRQKMTDLTDANFNGTGKYGKYGSTEILRVHVHKSFSCCSLLHLGFLPSTSPHRHRLDLKCT
jgi:hypothetical protein